MVHRTLAALVLLAFAATPVLAQEDCAQALKDTTAKFKTNDIGPQAAGIGGDLIATTGPMCSGIRAQ